MTTETFQFLLFATLALLIVSNVLLAYVIWRQGGRFERAALPTAQETETEASLRAAAADLAEALAGEKAQVDLESVYLSEAALYAAILAIEAKYARLGSWRDLQAAYEDWARRNLGVSVKLSDQTAKAMFRAVRKRPGAIAKKVFRTVDMRRAGETSAPPEQSR